MGEPFVDWLRRLRKALDLTQHELAERVGCSESTLRKIESGRLRPSRQLAERLALCLEIPLGEHPAFVGAARKRAASASPLTYAPEPSATPHSSPSANHLPVLSFPTPLVPLIGRTHDVVATIQILQQSEVRLLNLIGPPGVGKTRLAMHIAANLQGNFGDGVAFVPLASVQSYDLLISTIAQVVGVQAQSGRSISESLAGFLREKQLLLVLDNLEQLAAVCAPLTNLLGASPRLKLLCTSRVVLHLAGEHSYTVHPLDLPTGESSQTLANIVESPAVALLTERVRGHQPGFTLTPEVAKLALQLCRHLDGLPLAIELAAAQLRMLSIAELLSQFERLGSAGPLRLLRSGPQHWSNQTTLWDTIATSYELLSEPARALFSALAYFPGGCTLDAALTVCAISGFDETGLLGLLAELVDSSLCQRVTMPGHQTRFWMLETIRAFALANRTTEHDDQTLALRHVAYYRAFAERAELGVLGKEQQRWLGHIITEQPNVRTALTVSLAAADQDIRREALRIATALWWGWWACGYGSEARTWIEQALAAVPGETELQIRGWYASGALAIFAGDAERGADHIERSLALARAKGARSLEAHALIFMAALIAFGGNPDEGARLIEQSIALFRESSPPDNWGLGLALMSRRMFVIYQGDYTVARAAAEEALMVFTRLGQPYGIALALNSLGDVARLQGADVTAASHYRRAIALLRESGVISDLPSMLHNRAYAELRCGELRVAADCLREALVVNQRMGHLSGLAECLTGCAGLAALVDQPIHAAGLFGAIDALYAPEPGPRWPPERQEYERYRAAVHALLDNDAFTQVYETVRMRPIGANVSEAVAWLEAFSAQA